MVGRLCAFVCAVTVFFALICQPAPASEPRVALVIGNSEYGPTIGRLKNPANDATLMAETLKALGFSVDLVLNADQRTMKRAIKSFGARLRATGQSTTGFFYYAGHGIQVEGTNYLLPVGADIEAEADVDIESVAADDVMTQMQAAGNAVNLVFLDACRNNPLARTVRSASRGLARLDAPRGSFVGYSTAPGDVAADGDGANSPYAVALAEGLREPGISIEEVHRNVRAKVLAETSEKQTPWDSSSLTGPVVLLEKAPQLQPQPAPDRELVFWESIKDSKDPADFEAYIAQYPAGTFAQLARNKIQAFKQAAPEPPAQAAVVPQQPAAAPEPPAQTAAIPQQPGTAATLVIGAGVKAEIDSYLENTRTSSKLWALAISKNGQSIGVGSCLKMSVGSTEDCRGNVNAATQGGTNRLALKRCGAPGECVLLYEGDRKVANVDLVVAQGAGAAQQAAAVQPDGSTGAQTAPTNQGTLVVTAEIKSRVDSYLQNSRSSSNFWALAISKDGRNIGVGSCSKLSGATGACRENGNVATQNATNSAALKHCGKPGDCILLYEGGRKVSSLQIAAQ